VAAAALSLAASSGAGFEFVPESGLPGAMRLTRSTFEGQGTGYTARVQRIDEAERRAYLERVTGHPVDPFAAEPGRAPRYLTFLIEIRSDAAGSLVFQPQNCWLVTDRKEVLYPVGIDGLRTTYALSGLELGTAFEAAKPAVLEGSRTLEPGQALTGLLVYPVPRSRARRLTLDLQFATPDGEVVRLSAPYRRVKRAPGGVR